MAQVEAAERPRDVESDHPPQPLVGHPDDAGGGDRHLAHEGERRLLEQDGKAAVGAGPGDPHPQDAVFGTAHPRHPRLDEAVMLEEVEVPPGCLLPVVRLGWTAACRARKGRARLGDNLQPQFVRMAVLIEMLDRDPPRRRQPEPEGEDVVRAHGVRPPFASTDASISRNARRWADPKASLSGRTTA